jgi:hypothetical protein
MRGYDHESRNIGERVDGNGEKLRNDQEKKAHWSAEINEKEKRGVSASGREPRPE